MYNTRLGGVVGGPLKSSVRQGVVCICLYSQVFNHIHILHVCLTSCTIDLLPHFIKIPNQCVVYLFRALGNMAALQHVFWTYIVS